MGSSNNIKIGWNDYDSHLLSTVKSCRSDSTFSDVTLVCENSQVEAHKIILASFSPLFLRILQDHPDPHPLIYLSGVKLKDMMQVLDYMYSGQLDMVMEDADSIYEMFKELEIQGCNFTNPKSYSATSRKRRSTETVEPPPSKKATKDGQVSSSFPATWISQDVIDDMMFKSELNGSNHDEGAVTAVSHIDQDGIAKDDQVSQDDGDSKGEDVSDIGISNEVNEMPFPVDYQKKKVIKCRE